MIDFELTCCALDNFFFDCTFGDEAVDDDLLFLADTVSAVYGLEVDLGFQSESKIMTTFALWRLIPKPPALVERIKICLSEFGL